MSQRIYDEHNQREERGEQQGSQDKENQLYADVVKVTFTVVLKVSIPIRVSYLDKSSSPEKEFRAQEERRVLFVGRIVKGTTKQELTKTFLPFGRIVSIEFQEHTENFAYVTFASSADAYQAVVHGKDAPIYSILRYDRRSQQEWCHAPSAMSSEHQRLNNKSDVEHSEEGSQSKWQPGNRFKSLPNVGKSSIINSLKRNRACSVGATPGVTKAMQEVQLDSKIKLLDSPGVVFASSKSMNEGSFALKNAVKVESVDPIPAATAILQRCTKRQMMDLYCLPEYETPEEFFALKAQRQGKLKSGGVVDMDRAARGLIDDWNSGKIRYYTMPPEKVNSEVSATIVTQMSREFDLESYAQMEIDMLQELPESFSACPAVPVPSAGPVDAAMDQDKGPFSELLPENVVLEEAVKDFEQRAKKKRKRAGKEAKRENDAELDKQLLLPGNERKAKKILKLMAKKQKKQARRTEKAVAEVAGNLENFSL
ncbi:guanine nucleotide-binding protein-like 3 homolog [Homalodisca vitripennis]|uniref:guanine nucleotide-binding protein-like 3 homolog n=1 Tax=Homalodisca vitripennis TaxID=197043 RepID=UPI001EEC7A8F|nr:guanine nucleotide-binding protein-like 3 homolog [Homalodisca vitripennis]